MRVNVGICGFGRVGRLVLRQAMEHRPKLLGDDEFRVVAINDPNMTVHQAAYLFKYDTTHGTFAGSVEAKDSSSLLINDLPIHFGSVTDPAHCPWLRLGVDVVIDASGAHTSSAAAQAHLEAGALKVLIAAPPAAHEAEPPPVLVLGVNSASFDVRANAVVSAPSCTVHCLAPLLAALDASAGVHEAVACIIHAVTASQHVCDGAPKPGASLRSGRAGGNLVPAATGAAACVARLLPRLRGRLLCSAWRAPLADVSAIQLALRTQRPTSLAHLLAALRAAAAEGPLRGALRVCDAELVSSDFRGERAACVVDAHACAALNEHCFSLAAWFDNEAGYAARVLETALFMRHQMPRGDKEE